jgi:hypothetical protein
MTREKSLWVLLIVVLLLLILWNVRLHAAPLSGAPDAPDLGGGADRPPLMLCSLPGLAEHNS